ncbi:hypothetical protein EWY84_09505 [Salmonella enterica subsp. enterica serovar Infantis]|nr:hypothetical protein [Salmonella enterica subsp. enterica serovar Infantis]
MTRQTFQVPVAYTIIKPTDGVLGDLIPSINKWSAQQAAHLSGPGVKLEALKEIAINNETKQWRITGREAINGDVWFWMPPTALVFDHEVVGKTTYPRDVPLFSVAECVENVVGWSTARGILENGRWATQVTKFYEEDGEAATGISKTQRQAIMDGIGDALVVMVNVISLAGGNAKAIALEVERLPERLLPFPTGDAHRLFHKMRLYSTLMYEALYIGNDLLWQHDGKGYQLDTRQDDIYRQFEKNMRETICYANALANAYDTTLEQCFSLAWDEIKDRKGYLNADGIFIKESDAK